jgi:transposase
VKRFLKNGNRCLVKRSNCGRRAQAIAPHVTDHILSHAVLEAQATMTLNQRCEDIRRATGAAWSPTKLQRYYRRHGIRYLKPQTVYQQELKKDQAEL